MDTQLESNVNVSTTDTSTEAENPMQERHIGEVEESVEATAEDILMARRLDAQDDAGPIFVP